MSTDIKVVSAALGFVASIVLGFVWVEDRYAKADDIQKLQYDTGQLILDLKIDSAQQDVHRWELEQANRMLSPQERDYLEQSRGRLERLETLKDRSMVE